MTALKQETKRTAEAIFDVIRDKESPVSAGDIAREFNLGNGRHADLAQALKLLVKQDKVEKTGEGRGSKYLIVRDAKPLTKAEAQEQLNVPPVPEGKKGKAVPVHMVEVPRATLKVLVKAVMQCCTPMDNTLLRATMQCMEKLI